MARYKILVVEVDGVELDAQTETPLDADRVYFDPSVSGLTANNLQAAIEELASSTGSASNFSFSTVSNQTVTIPVNQQMAVFGEITIDGAGDLIISGELALLDWR
jgi:hypothetical protein